MNGKLEGIDYSLFIMKEYDYNMKLMTSVGTLSSLPNHPKANRSIFNEKNKKNEKVPFDYAEPFVNHFKSTPYCALY